MANKPQQYLVVHVHMPPFPLLDGDTFPDHTDLLNFYGLSGWNLVQVVLCEWGRLSGGVDQTGHSLLYLQREI